MPLIETEEAARRLARAIASDLSLYNEEKIIRGIESDSLFEELSEEIEEGRALYKSRVSPDLYHRNFYDRALQQSPANLPALRGAAKLAAKSGATERAKDLYERLLAADPQNATAKAYLAKHAPQDTPAPEPNDESAPSSGG